MNDTNRMLAGLLVAAVFAAPAAAVPAPVAAPSVSDDPTAKVYLKDGRVIEGAILREIDGYIYLKVGIGEMRIKPSDYTKIERRGGTASAAPVDLGEEKGYRTDPIVRADGVYRGAVISLEETVGTHMTATPLRDAIDELETDEIDILVLKVNSGGGMLIEIEKMSNVIHEEFKPRFHTVAWIESAISAAAMTSYTCNDIYFMPKGNFGAATGWFQRGGSIGLVEGRSLEEALYLMERIAERGEHSPELFRSMQVLEAPISYDRDEATGEVTIYADTSGQHILNDGSDILTLNSTEALHVNLSRGTAETLDEIERSIIANNPGMNIEDIVWVGDVEETELYPITEAERIQREWREEADFIETRLVELTNKYSQARANAQNVSAFVQRAERYLGELERYAKRHVNLAFTRNLSDEFFRREREFLAELRRR
ncbi:MAG: hypothetical protein AAF108_01085 [Planctomycetota bacterium]